MFFRKQHWMVFLIWVCLILAGCGGNGTAPITGTPAVVFVSVPPIDSHADLMGRALNVKPDEYRIATFIYVSGWWTKPFWDESLRLTSIKSDGTWTCPIVTGGSDEKATRIASFLVPRGYMPPIASGQANIPAEVPLNAVASVEVTRSGSDISRVISFSGYEWTVKKSDIPVGPPNAGNYFSDSPQDVWVDGAGRLHLKISHRNGRWLCSEVVCRSSLGFGTYKFTLDSDPTALDQNAVLGLFTWADAPDYAHREIDIEFSKWSNASDPNAQFVLQPWDQPDHRHRFGLAAISGSSTHSFTWRSDSIAFDSIHGSTPLASWTYSGPGVPVPGNECPRINLWLVGGSTVPPTNGAEIEVIVKAFEHTP
jgi:hypothetical protein